MANSEPSTLGALRRSGWRSRVMVGTARWVNRARVPSHSTPQATFWSYWRSASRAMLATASATSSGLISAR